MRNFLEYKRSGKLGQEIFNKMFQARQVAHIKHLQSTSYSEHKALDTFYSGILDLIDEFIECYQGQYGIVKVFDKIDSQVDSSPIDYIDGFCNDLKNFHGELNRDSHLQNIIDEMLGLSYRTLYKLKHLK